MNELKKEDSFDEKQQNIFEFILANTDENGIYNGVDLPDTRPITESLLVYWPLQI